MAKKDNNRLVKKMKNAINLPKLSDARRRLLEVEKSIYNFKHEKIGQGKTYFVKTYGCQGNVVDGENISGILEKAGYTKASDPKSADVLILNTCAIRDTAESKVFGYIGEIATHKKSNPDVIFAIAGCMTQEEKTINEILSKYHHVDIVFGTHNIDNLIPLIKNAQLEKDTIVDVQSNVARVVEGMPATRESKIKAFVNVTFGCDNFCTYCIVPFTRGQERSRSKKDILDEVNSLIKEGYKEVMLIGQNVNNYGKDIGESFVDLMEEVAKTKIDRVRFTTSNPWNFDEKLIEVIDKYDNIMPHVHLPIQSGSEKVLVDMNRKNSMADYLELVSKLKNIGCSVTTDIIVGFPTETEADFDMTYELVTKAQFDNAYSFVFSPRQGTVAANMEPVETYETNLKRLHKLQELIIEVALKQNKKYLNNKVEVLIEGPSKKNKDVFSGYTRDWKLVNIKSNKLKPGDIVEVNVTKIRSHSLIGEL